jgi:formylglycine-generating enzyme required for sulfatase activity
MRGSSWLDDTHRGRVAMRSVFHRNARRDFIGFRVAMDAPR